VPNPDVTESFNAARSNLESGRLREAEIACRTILASNPEHAGAVHMLGLIALQTGHLAPAEELLARSIHFDPSNWQCLNHLALARLSLGKIDHAIADLQKVIELAPQFPDAHNSLGAALKRRGRIDEAMTCYRQALSLRPGFPEAANNLGVALAERRNWSDAIDSYREALSSRPTYVEALSNLGDALRATGKTNEAAEALSQAVILRPDSPELLYNLGIALHADGRPAEAVTPYRKALSLRPDFADALTNLGNALQDLNEFDEAIAVYRRAISQRPTEPESHNNLGKALKETGDLPAAIDEYRAAISLRPAYADAHTNLANALVEQGRLDDAIASFRRALDCRSDDAVILSKLGYTLGQQGHHDEAKAALDKAMTVDPASVDAQWNMSLALLLRGDFENGWPLYEARHRTKSMHLDREFLDSFWDGSPLQGRQILLIAEQGLGDSIQFIRYVPMVAERGSGGGVLLLCQPRLRKLFEGQLGIRQVISMGEMLPPFDVCCPLMSLPHVVHTREETIPHQVPYLRPDPTRVSQWDRILSAEPGKPRVGLAWAGNPTYRNDRHRSIPLSAFELLAGAAPSPLFVSLQKGPAASQDRSAPIPLRDWTNQLDDLIDTAALIQNLDLVIAVDTAVAHLAGALAKPVWLLIPFAPDWRWQLDRRDSPWYPTMRLFRQPARGDWTTPIAEIATELSSFPPPVFRGRAQGGGSVE
jgi:tetratricopeptide (TPR) repeat protein